MSSNALKNEFLLESFENLSNIDNKLTVLEKNPSDKELMNSLYRTIHTMKGSSSFLGYSKLQDLTHATESLLDLLREGNLSINSSIVDLLLNSFDLCHSILKNIEEINNEGEIDIASMIDQLELVLKNTREVQNNQEIKVDDSNKNEPECIQTLISDHIEDSKFLNNGNDSVVKDVNRGENSSSFEPDKDATPNHADSENIISDAALESLKESFKSGALDESALEGLNLTPSQKKILFDGDIPETNEPKLNIKKTEDSDVKTDDCSATTITPEIKDSVITSTSAQLNGGNKGSSIADSVVRVNVAVLDKIMNIVGELVLNRNQVLQYAGKKPDPEFTRLSQQLNMITSELQSEVMSTRMQPIGSILTKFERLVRDFAKENNKKIQLKLSGQETELDKTLIEAIKDPIVHIIRNAADHGLEVVEDRKTAGKAPIGTITIKSYNESGQVTVEISDDGRGIDSKKVAAKAIEKGLITQEEAQNKSEQQILAMVFHPGFSTAEKITNISGRGVGMDVVKTNIEKIGGSVSLQSTLGEGTTFKFRIPLTLAIVPALITRSGGESYAIPQLNLVELVRLSTPDDFKNFQCIQGTKFLKLRGHLTPIFHLNERLGLTEIQEKSRMLNECIDNTSPISNSEYSNKGIQENSLFENDSMNIIILSAENKTYGIVVDEILDTEEIVVKPLNDDLKELNIFGGATIMGDGKVALILDAVGFFNKFTDVRDAMVDDQSDQINNKNSDKSQLQDGQENLLFKLEDDQQYAIPLNLVSRLEEFQSKAIEKTGEQPIVRYLNQPMPLIDLEKTLALDAKSKISNIGSTNLALPCIVTTIRNKNYGFIVKEISDIAIEETSIDSSAVDRNGIIGTMFINNRVVSLINPFGLVDSQKLGVGESPGNEKKYHGQKVLLVEDSSVYRKLEGEALESLGFEVLYAENGEEAYELLINNEEIKVIVTDIEMPIMDGFEFSRKVRSFEKYRDLPVIALSTKVTIKDKEKGKNCGFNYHLEKFKQDELFEVIYKITA